MASGDERPVIVDVPVGRGDVFAHDFNPVHRESSRADDLALWNAVLRWNPSSRHRNVREAQPPVPASSSYVLRAMRRSSSVSKT
jgi:hypothetical protein